MLCIEVFVYIQSVGGAPSRCSLDYRDDVRDVSHLLLTTREASTQDWDLRGVLSSTSFGITVSPLLPFPCVTPFLSSSFFLHDVADFSYLKSKTFPFGKISIKHSHRSEI